MIGRGSLVFGGAAIGGLYAPVSDEAAAATLQSAWDAGIRAFDTAPHYGVGLSEQRIGGFLAGCPRAEFVVSTKVGRLLVPAAGPVDGVEQFYGTPALSRVRDYSADGTMRSLDDSLRRLRLDRTDIALIHDPDDHMAEALDGAYPALARLRADGTVGAIGVGVNSASVAEWFVARCDLDCVLVAGRYTLLDDSAAAWLFPLCLARGVEVLAAGCSTAASWPIRPTAPASTTPRPRPGCWPAPAASPRSAPATTSRWRPPRCATSCATPRSRRGGRRAHPEEIRADAGYLGFPIPDALWAELDSQH